MWPLILLGYCRIILLGELAGLCRNIGEADGRLSMLVSLAMTPILITQNILEVPILTYTCICTTPKSLEVK